MQQPTNTDFNQQTEVRVISNDRRAYKIGIRKCFVSNPKENTPGLVCEKLSQLCPRSHSPGQNTVRGGPDKRQGLGKTGNVTLREGREEEVDKCRTKQGTAKKESGRAAEKLAVQNRKRYPG